MSLEQTKQLFDLAKEVPAKKPPLSEVAAMPYPLSVLTMRKHYVPKWGVPLADGPLKKWKAAIQWETREEGTDEFTVEAVDEDEAKEVAEEQWQKDHEHDWDTEIIDTKVSEVRQ